MRSFKRATNISVPSYVAASMRKITHPSIDAKGQFLFHPVLDVLNYLWELFVGVAKNHPKMLTASPNITLPTYYSYIPTYTLQ